MLLLLVVCFFFIWQGCLLFSSLAQSVVAGWSKGDIAWLLCQCLHVASAFICFACVL